MGNIVSNILKKEEIKQELCLKHLILSDKDEDYPVYDPIFSIRINGKKESFEKRIYRNDGKLTIINLLNNRQENFEMTEEQRELAKLKYLENIMSREKLEHNSEVVRQARAQEIKRFN